MLAHTCCCISCFVLNVVWEFQKRIQILFKSLFENAFGKLEKREENGSLLHLCFGPKALSPPSLAQPAPLFLFGPKPPSLVSRVHAPRNGPAHPTGATGRLAPLLSLSRCHPGPLLGVVIFLLLIADTDTSVESDATPTLFLACPARRASS
jgi:hypothetical protein